MRPPVDEVSIRDRVAWAERAARTVMRAPSLCSVSIEFDGRTGSPVATVCGFQHERRDWLGRALLDVCQVQVLARAESAAVSSHGTFKRRQYRQLAAIKDSPFPPRPLDLSALAIEPVDAVSRMRQHVRRETPVEDVEPINLGLVLTIREHALAWQGAVDLPGVGIHTLILDAGSGDLRFHKFDRYHPE